MQSTIMYSPLAGGIYRVVLPDGENIWYDALKHECVHRDGDYLSISSLLRAGYKIVGKVNNFKPKL